MFFGKLKVNFNIVLGTAHCANMYPESDNDLPQLKNTRAQVFDLIQKWLKEE